MPGTSSSFIQFRPGENGISLMLARNEQGRPTVAGTYMPAVEGERQRRQDQAVTFSDFSGGMGFSRRYLPNVYAYTDPGYARSPGLVMPPGLITSVTLPSVGSPALGAITASAEYNGDLYFTCGPYILKAAGGTGTPVVAGHLSSVANTRYDSLVIFNGCLYAGGMVPPNIAGLAKFDGTSWTVSTTVLRRFLASVYWVDSDGVGGFRLVGTDGDSSFRYTADDPMDIADWTPGAALPGIQVGNTSYAINSIAASNRHVYFVKQNGVHDVDGRGYAPNLTPYWEQSYDPDNGNVSLVHDAKIFASHFQGLDRVDVSSQLRLDEPQWVHPGAIIPNETPIFGPVVGLCSDSGWLVAAFYNGHNSYILYGQDRTKLGLESGPPWVWHGSEATIRGERVTHLRVTSLDGNPRLWIASLSGTTPKLRWLSLPKASSPLQDYLNGGPWRPAENFSLFLPAEDWGNPLASKTLLQYSLRADQLGQSFLELFAAIDAGSYLREGISSKSPIEVMDGSGLVTGFDVALRVDGETRAGIPPLLRGLEARASVHLKPVEVRAYTVVVSDNLTLRSGASDDADAKEMWDRLQKLQTAGPVEFVDEWGERYLAEVQEGIDHATVAHPFDDSKWAKTATVRVTLLNRISRWNDGSRFGGRMVWSRDAGPLTLTLELTGGGILLRWRLLNAPLSPWPNVTIVREVPGGEFVPGPTVPGNDFEWEDEDANEDGDGPGEYCYYLELPDGRTSETVCITVPAAVVTPAASFSVRIIKKRVLIAGVYTDLYVVSAENTTPGAWTTFTWAASGTGVPTGYQAKTGPEPFFNTAFSTLTGASITLTTADGISTRTLTNSNLSSGVTTQAIPLFTAESADAGANDGTNWRDDPPSSGTITVVGRGPAWGGTAGLALRSSDFLATSASESDPFGGTEITADWMEQDVSATNRAVGCVDGRVAFSTNGGSTWTASGGPAAATPVLRIIISRFTAGQAWVLVGNGIYRTDDWTAATPSWVLVRAAASGQTFTDIVLSHSRNVVVGYDAGGATMEKAEPDDDDNSVPFLLPNLDPPLARLNAVVANTRLDKFGAYDNSVPPRTIVTVENGGYLMTAGQTMPVSVTAAPVRGMVPFGDLYDETVGAGGDIGWNWLSFGQDTSGFYLIRQVNVAGAGAGPILQIGHGVLTTPPAVVTPGSTVRLFAIEAGDRHWWALDRAAETWAERASHASDNAGAGVFSYAESDSTFGVLVLGGTPRHWRTTLGGDTALEWTEATPTSVVAIQSAIRRGATWYALSSVNQGGSVTQGEVGVFTSADGNTWSKTFDYVTSITGSYYGPRGYTVTGDGHIYFHRSKTSLAAIALYRDDVELVLPAALTSLTMDWFGSLGGDVALVTVRTGFVPSSHRLWRCAGSTVTDVTPGDITTTTGTTVYDNAVSPDGQTWLWRYGDGGLLRLYRTTNAGTSWTSDITWTSIGRIVFDPAEPTTWFIRGDKDGTGIKVWKSTDNGATFPTSFAYAGMTPRTPELIPVGVFY